MVNGCNLFGGRGVCPKQVAFVRHHQDYIYIYMTFLGSGIPRNLDFPLLIQGGSYSHVVRIPHINPSFTPFRCGKIVTGILGSGW